MMKVSLNTISNYYTELPSAAKLTAKASGTEKGYRNYDAIIIQSDSRQIAEKTFSASLAHTVSGQVRDSHATEQKLQDLKSQVLSGTYPIQYNQIASSILFSKEV